MNNSSVVWIPLGILAIAAALYGLHRLCLWLEAEGYMYYLQKKAGGGGGMSSLIELQKALEPTTRYVVEAKEEQLKIAADECGDQGQTDDRLPGSS